MVTALLLSLLLAQGTSKPAPQPQPTTPPKTAPAPAQKPPAPAQPRAQTPRPAQGANGGIALTVTDSKGSPFANVTVEMDGVASATRTTDSAGQTSFPSLRPGAYRLRFSGDGVVAFEREITVRAGTIEKPAITLTAAAPPKPAAPPPAPAPTPPPAPAVGPVGEPQLGSLAKLADRERNAKERRELLLACSGNTRSMMLVLTDEQPQRIYESAESTFYVISGQGAAIVGKLQSTITTGSFVAVPRGTSFVLARQGNRPLVMLWTLSGEPCEMAK